MAFTVVPLHNISLPAGIRIPFGNDLVFQETPSWVKDDKSFLKYLSHHDQRSVLDSENAFVADYEADSIGAPDPEHLPRDGERQRSIQESRTRCAILANLATWLRQPSSLSFTVSLHACMWQIPGQTAKQPILQQSEVSEPLHTSEKSRPVYCHPKDARNPVTAQHITEATSFYPTLRSIQPGRAVWIALRAIWSGLTSYAADIRYLWFWIALEALFGPEDSSELSHKLAERIAFFIAESSTDARDLFRKAKKCYGVRSKIVHGRWTHSPDIDEMMEDTEAIVRTAFRHVIAKPNMLAAFASKQRDQFLADLIFQKTKII